MLKVQIVYCTKCHLVARLFVGRDLEEVSQGFTGVKHIVVGGAHCAGKLAVEEVELTLSDLTGKKQGGFLKGKAGKK